jgi:hypothetical protein
MIWHPSDCGTLSERNVFPEDAASWGVKAIFGMVESRQDRLSDRLRDD